MLSAFSMIMICCVFVFVLLVAYFRNKHIDTPELKLYGLLIFLNFVGLLLEMGCYLSVKYLPPYSFFSYFINKLFLIYYVLFILVLFVYVYTISTTPEKLSRYGVRVRYLSLIVLIICGLTIAFLPLNLNYGDKIYSYGHATNFVFIYSFIALSLCTFVMIKRFKYVKTKKYIPLIIYIIGNALIGYLQSKHPEFTLATVMESIDLFIMYFTIENPDVKMINQLELAKLQAEKANMAKTDFLSSMSHEIRTPLNAIVGFSEMIASENTIDGCKENAKDIVLASHTLLDIVNGILDISKIEANKLEIINKEYNFLPELNNLTKLMIPRINEKPIELKTDFDKNLPFAMYGDIGKIKQVITNLLTNACKYTDNGTIDFIVKCTNDKDVCNLVVTVKDTGRGIKQEEIDKLFTKFNRLDEDKNTNIEGTGLGLAITKKLVEMMNGKIEVTSEYGVGSTFTVYLKQKIVKLEGEVVEETKKEDVISFEGYKVLVVDDNKMNLKVADKLLQQHKLDTTLVSSGKECLELIKNASFDIILMDDMMPEMSGPETLNLLKQIPDFKTPTIALTANATEGIRENYINMGFDDYLAKPIEKPELVRVLKQFLGDEVKPDDVKILIVDDNPINIKVAVKTLKPYDFIVDTVLSGKECLNKVKETTYDLIFVDYMMPEMDGIETLHHLKDDFNLKTTIIALTADATDGAKEKFLEAGFDEYIAKPITRDIMSDVIARRLHKTLKDDKVAYLKQNGIDVIRGVCLLGDMDMYNDTLKTFMKGAQERFTNLNKYKDNHDMNSYMFSVNGLKGDCQYLGFTDLAIMSLDHELKAKANEIDYIDNHYDELINEARRVFEVVKKYFD